MDQVKHTDLSSFMRSEVERFYSSGKSIRDFCNGKPYTFHKLNYWKTKVRREEIGGSAQLKTGFVSLKPIGGTEAVSTVKAEIVCPSGIQIKIYEPINASFIKSLL